jgi:hypothetical protein
MRQSTGFWRARIDYCPCALRDLGEEHEGPLDWYYGLLDVPVGRVLYCKKEAPAG